MTLPAAGHDLIKELGYNFEYAERRLFELLVWKVR